MLLLVQAAPCGHYGERLTGCMTCNIWRGPDGTKRWLPEENLHALMPAAELWLHGHLHCRHDYTVVHADRRRTRVISQARGLEAKGECKGFDERMLIAV